jgi:hypothetical protein
MQKFTSEGFLLEKLQSNSSSNPNRTRKPDQASEEVLASVRLANKHFMLICFAFISVPQSIALSSVA